MGLDHSFDWKGLWFATKILLASATVGMVGYAGLWYVAELSLASVPPPTLITVIEAPPIVAQASVITFSTTTSQRIINALTIADAMPQTGKFVVADLEHMRIVLYQDGIPITEY